MKGEVVTLVTMMGEVVGRLKDQTDSGYVIESPRLFVPGENNAGGFAPGLSMTGKQEPSEAIINKAVTLTVTQTHPDVEAGKEAERSELESEAGNRQTSARQMSSGGQGRSRLCKGAPRKRKEALLLLATALQSGEITPGRLKPSLPCRKRVPSQ